MKILHVLKLSVGPLCLLSDTTSVNDGDVYNWIHVYMLICRITAETHNGRHWVKYALVSYKIADSILMSPRSVQGARWLSARGRISIKHAI